MLVIESAPLQMTHPQVLPKGGATGGGAEVAHRTCIGNVAARDRRTLRAAVAWRSCECVCCCLVFVRVPSITRLA